MRMRLLLPAFLALAVISMTVAFTANSATPPDPLQKLLGKPTQLSGKTYYLRTRGGVKFACRSWVYGTRQHVSAYVEQCVAIGKTKPKQSGPAS